MGVRAARLGAICVISLTRLASAQPAPGNTSAAAAAAATGPQARPSDTLGAGIRRNSGSAPSLGDFPAADSNAPTPPPSRNAPAGPLGGTGTVADERGPHGEMRGSTGPAPGEIDMTRPIGPADVARLVRRYDPQMRGCYERLTARVRNAPGGRVAMRFVVNRDGTVSRPEASELAGLPALSGCLREQLALMRFPRPESGVLPFNYAMVFAPPAPPPPPARGPRGRR
ncbi:MAG: AgmX/PglI C-terminal domain-containing protein [Myxococcales bacterium]|nr:AgmX/PglI C-terminal domain-containing protein [Myxococcales bacterium]